jgi:C-terminal binding-module, SLH-like, of glucodextranase
MSAPAPRAPLLLALALLAPAPLAGAAEPRLVVSFEDPPGDATGPGSYLPPRGPEFTDGDFDLRRFAVYDEGDVVRLEVTLGAAIRRPDASLAGAAAPDLSNGIFLQNVDVYVDRDPASRAGFSACIPGRRVAFADGRTWEAAVVLTPQPAAARAAAAEALGEAASHVLFPGPLEVRGATIVARVPAAALGGAPRREWGWSVHVSGARWAPPGAAPEPPRGGREADALTMPVLPSPEARAFGGAPAGDAHPRVVDVLLPAGADQKAVLGSFDATTGKLARVPFVYGVPPSAGLPPAAGAGLLSLSPRLSLSPGPAAPASREPGDRPKGDAGSSGPVLTVAEIADDRVRLAGPNIGLAPQQIGRVLGRDGATVGHVVLDEVLENGAVGHVVSGRENVAWGARVRFDSQARR